MPRQYCKLQVRLAWVQRHLRAARIARHRRMIVYPDRVLIRAPRSKGAGLRP
jgi:hypothetical protein